jgi:glycerophosphoryl diester phosphodiesterase
VVRHEPEIGATTDVVEKFPERRTSKQLDGKAVLGWFTEDFTLAEIKTLRAKQPRPYRATAWDGIYEVPTLQEVTDLAKSATASAGREICIYPETKHPTYFADQGLDIDAALVAVLDRNGLSQASSPVIIQSFETGNLKKLKGMTGVRLVQLMDDFDAQPYDLAKAGAKTTYRDLMQPAALAAIATYAYGIGPWKRTILPESNGALGSAGDLIANAHAAGLKVHPYTFRDEPQFLAQDYGNDASAEYLQFYRLGVDGLFSDFPDTAVRARERFAGT